MGLELGKYGLVCLDMMREGGADFFPTLNFFLPLTYTVHLHYARGVEFPLSPEILRICLGKKHLLSGNHVPYTREVTSNQISVGPERQKVLIWLQGILMTPLLGKHFF